MRKPFVQTPGMTRMSKEHAFIHAETTLIPNPQTRNTIDKQEDKIESLKYPNNAYQSKKPD